MTKNRINDILSSKEKCDVFYNNRLVWIQEIDNHTNTVQVGFVDNFEEKKVNIDDLYE